MAAQPEALYPAEAQQASSVSEIAPRERGTRGSEPSTLDMMAMQGFSGWRLGLWTRSVFSGGSRIGL